MAKILNIGDRICCPRKRHLIAVVNRNIYSGDLMRMTDFDFEDGQQRIAGERMVCAICGSEWLVQGKVHTDEGWKPGDPVLEPVHTNRRR